MENNLENIQIKKEKGLNTQIIWEQFYTWWKSTTSQMNFCSFWCKYLRSCFLVSQFGFSIRLLFCMDVSLFLLSPENHRYFWLGMTSVLPTALWTAFLPKLNVFWELVRFWMSKQNGLALCQPSRKKCQPYHFKHNRQAKKDSTCSAPSAWQSEEAVTATRCRADAREQFWAGAPAHCIRGCLQILRLKIEQLFWFALV